MAEPLRLLCVDDEPHILNSLRRFCRNHGFIMLCAPSGQEALALLERKGVCVILTDFQMPQMNGLDFLRRAGKLYPNIPGIILSGYTDLPVVTAALRDGEIFGFVPKPWDRNQLALLIRAAAAQTHVAAKES